MTTSEDLTRYTCQIKLAEFGVAGQKKLANAAILCVGAGGLAATALPYLAAAGVGRVGVIDGDQVALRNLHRQVLFTEADIGQNKALTIGRLLQKQNPNIVYDIYPEFLTLENAEKIILPYDLVLDCSDNFFTRYLINDVCFSLNIPDISAAVIGFEGLLTVFARSHGPCYRCLYPNPPPAELNRNCSDEGVLPTTPGLFGVMQATEALKIILGAEKILFGQLLKINLWDWSSQKRTLNKKEDCLLCAHHTSLHELPRYSDFAQFSTLEITPQQLKDQWHDWYIIDVRENDEYEQYNLGTPHLPFSKFAEHAQQLQLPKNTIIAVCCAHGVRSKAAAHLLRQQGYTNTVSLAGGLAAWQQYHD
jgi:molybdopterin/thiamine biosynthesis adenylyltransferase/rhodanese-related sulfurtransferase